MLTATTKNQALKFPVVGKLVKCSKCDRRILVERGLIGVDHTIGIYVTCWDCLESEGQKKVKERYDLEIV